MSEDVIIIGAGGQGRVIADVVAQCGDRVIGFLDDNTAIQNVGGIPVLGQVCDCVRYPDRRFIVGFGNNALREKIFRLYPDLAYYNAVHPRAYVASDVQLKQGVCIFANAVVNTGAKIGNGVIVNTAAVVEHDCIVEDWAHISPGAVLCGTVSIGRRTHVGAGAVVRNNIRIGDDVTIGVGAAVVKNIDAPGVYVGVPAKQLKTQD